MRSRSGVISGTCDTAATTRSSKTPAEGADTRSPAREMMGNTSASLAPFLSGGGEIGALMRSMDWSRTRLGSLDGWPQSLRTATSIVLGSPLALQLFWGPDLVLLYNDAARPMMGEKHLAAFGQPAFEHWPEVREQLEPLLVGVLSTGTATLIKNGMVPTWRSGFLEELYFSWSFSPIRVESGSVGGVFQVATETTEEVLGERRQIVLRELASQLTTAKSADEACVVAARSLEVADVPFAMIYLLEGSAPNARLVATSGIEAGRMQSPASIDISGAPGSSSPWPFAEVARTGVAQLVLGLDERFEPRVARGWTVPPKSALVLPLTDGGETSSLGFFVAGVSAGLHLDENYRGFLGQIARQIAGGVAQARAAEVERENARLATALRRGEEIRRDDLSRLFESVPVAMSLLRGPEHVYELFNTAHATLSRHRAILHKSIRACFPELPESFHTVLDRVYHTGEAVRFEDLPIRLESPGAPPEEIWITYTYTPLRGADGSSDGIVAAGFEVTERVLARKRLEDLTEQLRVADRRKDEFLAMLGHEMRNPLAPIVTAMDLMRLDGDHYVKERHVIERQVAHLLRLVEDLLDVSRIAHGKIELKRAPVEISAIVAQAIEMVSPLLTKRAHDLAVDVPREGLCVDGDEARLVQVVSNLLTNAAKYTPDHGHIAIRAAVERGEVILIVEDDGPGIHAELLPRLFDPFVQGDRPLDRAEGGIGLGLALVKNLVTLHGGSVHARNRETAGAELSVRLPALSADAVERTPPRPPERRTGAPRRVLVVDDNEDAAELVSLLLTHHGHEVVVASDGPQALQALRSFHAEVALLDIGLPVMSGLELARHIRDQVGGDAIHLIAVTGYGQARDIEATRLAGFDEHLTKPVRVADILASLERPGPVREPSGAPER